MCTGNRTIMSINYINVQHSILWVLSTRSFILVSIYLLSLFVLQDFCCLLRIIWFREHPKMTIFIRVIIVLNCMYVQRFDCSCVTHFTIWLILVNTKSSLNGDYIYILGVLIKSTLGHLNVSSTWLREVYLRFKVIQALKRRFNSH